MAGAGFIVGGLLRGVGTHMVEDYRARRDAALEELRQMRADQSATARQDRGFQQSRVLQAEGNAQQGEQNRATLEVSGRNQLALEGARTESELTVEDRRARHRMLLENLQHSNTMTREQAAFARQQADEDARAHREVERYDISSDGRMVGFNREGYAITQSEPGRFNPPNVPQRGGRTTGGARPAPAARPAPTTQNSVIGDDQVVNQFGPIVDQMYGELDPAERQRRARELAQRYRQ